MPMVEENGEAGWALWRLDEDEETLAALLPWNDCLRREWAAVAHPTRRQEWLGARVVAFALARRHRLAPTGLVKNAHGKPEWRGAAGGLSLTHAYPYVAAQVGTGAVGIDLEHVRAKLLTLAPRFLSDGEQQAAGSDLTTLALCWSAKESLYKWHGTKGLSFRHHLQLHPFTPREAGTLRATVHTPRGTCVLQLAYRTWPGHVLTWVAGQG